jgi:hypothetical protein
MPEDLASIRCIRGELRKGSVRGVVKESGIVEIGTNATNYRTVADSNRYRYRTAHRGDE